MGIYQPKYKDQKTGEVRTSKVWWASVFSMGKRERFSTGTENRAEANRIFKERQGDSAKGLHTPKKVNRVRFWEIAEAVVTDYKNNNLRSLEDLERRLDLHVLPKFGEALAVNITPGDIEKYKLQRKEEGAANATINRELSIVKRAFALAIDQGKLLQRPKIALLSEADNVRKGFPRQDQFDAIISQIEAMPEDRLPRIVRAVAIALQVTGWRKSELLGNKRRKIEAMQWTQVDFAAGTLALLDSKNGEGRLIPLDLPGLREVFQELREYTDKVQKEKGIIIPWVFHRDGKPVAGIQKAWKEVTQKAGCPGLLLHDFRRGAVRNYDRAGVPQAVAMKMTGHKTASVFQRYNIVDFQDLQNAAAALQETVKVSSKWAVSPAAASL